MIPTSRPLDCEVHIYCLALPPQNPSELLRLKQLLSESEIDRVNMLKSDQAKERFIERRGVLREILGGCLGIEPEDVRLDAGEHGKPYLVDCGENLRFNLSHAGEMFLLAVSAGIEVGIDIEAIDLDKPLNNMAKLAFSRHEQEELLKFTSSQLQTEAFFSCWVRKEACLKACGRGFSLPGSSFDVPLHITEPPMPVISCNQKLWHVMNIDVPKNYCAALAVEIGCLSLPPPNMIRMA
jgi:4'-phosphopantetheinyl transferase